MESKVCTKCKTELPIGSFRWKKDAKYRAGGRYRSDCRKCELDARDKERKRFIDRERVKRVYGTPAYNEIQKRSVEKRKAIAIDTWHERNTGLNCPIKWMKCTHCDNARLFKWKGSLKDSYTCRLCGIANEAINRTGKPVSKKSLKCVDCSCVIIGTSARKRCLRCNRLKARVYQRKNKIRCDRNIVHRARKYGATIERIDRILVYERDGWSCYICGITIVLSKTYLPNQATIDHVVALSLGGPHTYSNVRACCHQCNSHKGTTPQEAAGGGASLRFTPP